MLAIEYSIKKGHIADKETIKACHKSFKAWQGLLVIVAETLGWKMAVLTWLLTRFYKRKVTDKCIRYELFLFSSEEKNGRE